MAVSTFDLFQIGIGPSSAHTVGPLRATRQFTGRLERRGPIEVTRRRIRVELFGAIG